jgi:two-component system OmpR family sensor kinase
LLPETPVMSDLDPDAFAILFRNLVENALRHGAEGGSVEARLGPDGAFAVANDGPALSPAVLERLTNRFERASERSDGSGLGLAIVAAIAERIGSSLVLKSPRPGHAAGFEATIRLPIRAPSRA